MTYLTDEEIDYIIEYTGLDLAMQHPLALDGVPVVHFSKTNNVIEFITLISKEMGK